MVPDEGQEADLRRHQPHGGGRLVAAAGTEVFKLVMDRTIKLKSPVPDRYVSEVQVGQKAKSSTRGLRLHVRRER